MKTLQLFGLALVTLGWPSGLSAAVGPNYQRPTAPTPSRYADAELGTWKQATPADAIAAGHWWTVFADTALDGLERQAAENNQDLKAAVARVVQARALARNAKAEFFPSLTLDPAASHARVSDNTLNPLPRNEGKDFRVPLDLSYELDLWGRVRRSFEAANAETQARVAGFENILLLPSRPYSIGRAARGVWGRA